MRAVSAPATFSLFCPCGTRLRFDDATRGELLACTCGNVYRAPQRADALTRVLGRVRWAWRWIAAGDHRPAATVPTATYREGSPRVMCPCCDAIPDGDARWQCEFCWCAWNTFDTRGRCPGCDFTFPATFCPSCRRTTRHRDWYRPAALH